MYSLLFVVTETWLPSRCLVMTAFSDSTILTFRRHVTIYYSLQFCLYVCSLIRPGTASDDRLVFRFSRITACNAASHFRHSVTCSNGATFLIIWNQEARVGGKSEEMVEGAHWDALYLQRKLPEQDPGQYLFFLVLRKVKRWRINKVKWWEVDCFIIMQQKKDVLQSLL
jgi:hypothetical protein